MGKLTRLAIDFSKCDLGSSCDRRLTMSVSHPIVNLSCPSSGAKRFVERLRRVVYLADRDSSVVFLPLERSELSWLRPNINCLVAWRFPKIVLTAVSNARWVLSTHPDVVRAALALGRPAALIVETTEQVAADLPCFVWTSLDRPDSPWRDRIEKYFSILESATAIRAPTRAPFRFAAEPLRVACMASREYLCQLAGLLENLNEVTRGNFQVYFFALDREAKLFFREHYAGFLARDYLVSELWPVRDRNRFGSRSIAELAYASKSSLLLRAIRDGAKRLIYCDLDLYFFRSPYHLVERLGPTCSALLMPHWNSSYSNSRHHGIYNAGLMAVDESALDFLGWWRLLCLDRCQKNVDTGHYDDQAYLDMAPVCFPRVHSYRGGDENVGGWNFETLGVHRATRSSGKFSGGLALRGGKVVGSLHATHTDKHGFFEAKYAWDQMVNRMGTLEEPSKLLETMVWRLHEGYFPQIRRLEEIYQAVGNRIGKHELRFPAPLENFLLGPGRSLTQSWKPLRKVWRSLVLRKENSTDIHWLKSQSKLFFNRQSSQPKGDRPRGPKIIEPQPPSFART